MRGDSSPRQRTKSMRLCCPTPQFRGYAEEAMRWARQSKTEKERQALIELPCTLTQAALPSEHIFVVNDSPPESSALSCRLSSPPHQPHLQFYHNRQMSPAGLSPH